MSRIKSSDYSKTGDGNQLRHTTVYEDGSRREVTERADGSITVTDVDSNGHACTGDGARGLLGTVSDATRLNTTSEGETTAGTPSDGSESGGGSGGGCFLTSACMEGLSLADASGELETLRTFRDQVLLPNPDTRDLVAEYYAIAPSIVAAINRCPDAATIWSDMFCDLVVPCVKLVHRGQAVEAIDLYRSYTLALAARLHVKSGG